MVLITMLTAAGLIGSSLSVGEAPRAVAIESQNAALELIALTNLSRTSNGLKALLRDSRLSAVSESRSGDMITRNYFSHSIPPDDQTVVDILESLGVPFRSAGENIAWNDAVDFTTIQTAGEDFMNSPSHRKNILDPHWDRLGAGVAQGNGRKMYTVVFLQTANRTETRPAPVPDPIVVVATGDDGGQHPAKSEEPRQSARVELIEGRSGLLGALINQILRQFLNL
jgi:uncharacterized protein YkwD